MTKRLLFLFTAAALLAGFTVRAHAADLPKDVQRVPVVFTGGHDTDPRDGGRPVVLVAGGLGVPPEVFRDAFSRVHPADTNIGPTGDEARKNKAALMSVLGKYGITNDRLDTVSNRYRYVRSRGELWPVKPAVATALVKNGVIIGYELTSGGYGYSSVPTIAVPGVKPPRAKIELAFSKDFKKNGTLATLTLPTDKTK